MSNAECTQAHVAYRVIGQHEHECTVFLCILLILAPPFVLYDMIKIEYIEYRGNDKSRFTKLFHTVLCIATRHRRRR